MVIPKFIMVKIEFNVFSRLIHFSKCCLVSHYLYNENLLYCIFYEKKKYINFYFRFVNCHPLFLYHSFLLFLTETSFYDTVWQRLASCVSGRDGILYVRALRSSLREQMPEILPLILWG